MTTVSNGPDRNEPKDESDPIEILISALKQEKRAFLAVLTGGIVLSAIVIALLPRYFSASTVLLVAQPSQNANANAMAQLGALVGVPGAGATRSPEDMYAALLRSRTIEDAVIKKFDLHGKYEASTFAETRSILELRTQVSADKKTGLIALTFDDVSPELSAAVANAYVTELQALLSKIAVTEAQQRRQFYESELRRTEGLLRNAELNFRKLQSERGMVVTEALAESQWKTAAELRAKIIEKEVAMEAAQRFATTANPDVRRLYSEIAAMKQMLKQSEEGRGVDNVSNGGLDTVRAYREMKTQSMALEQIVKQLGLARMDEAREGPRLQQVDVAVPPEKPTKPKRLFLGVMATMGSAFLGVMIAVFRARGRRSA